MQQILNFKSETILVIEDDPSLNKVFCKYLGNAGFMVRGITTIAETLEYLSTTPSPSIIVLDLNLKDGSGTEILDVLQNARFNSTKVIIVSGQAFSPDDGLQKYRIDYTLLKPVTPRGLTALVTTLYPTPYSEPFSSTNMVVSHN